MSQTSDSSEEKRAPYTAMGRQALTVGGEVGCLTLGIVLASVFGGLWLDNLFGTKPVLMLLLVLASAPLSLVLTFWLAKRGIARPDASQVDQSETGPSEGDTTGE